MLRSYGIVEDLRLRPLVPQRPSLHSSSFTVHRAAVSSHLGACWPQPTPLVLLCLPGAPEAEPWQCECGWRNRAGNLVCGGRNAGYGCAKPRPRRASAASASKLPPGWEMRFDQEQRRARGTLSPLALQMHLALPMVADVCVCALKALLCGVSPT